MSNSNLQLALIAEAKRLGKRPDQLTAQEVSAVALKQMTPREAISNGAAAVESFIATKVGYRRVPLPVYEARKGPEGCGGCSLVGFTPKGAIYCKQCGCAGVMMEAALQDPDQSCRLPKGQKRWEKYVEPA